LFVFNNYTMIFYEQSFLKVSVCKNIVFYYSSLFCRFIKL